MGRIGEGGVGDRVEPLDGLRVEVQRRVVQIVDAELHQHEIGLVADADVGEERGLGVGVRVERHLRAFLLEGHRKLAAAPRHHGVDRGPSLSLCPCGGGARLRAALDAAGRRRPGARGPAPAAHGPPGILDSTSTRRGPGRNRSGEEHGAVPLAMPSTRAVPRSGASR